MSIFDQLQALTERWRPRYMVIAATDVGEGPWGMLRKTLPTRVIPVKFSAQRQSGLAHRFISLIETGRLCGRCPTAAFDEQ